MYCGVPTHIPVSVSRAPLGLARRERDTEIGDQRVAVVSSMFSGLMSRWIDPVAVGVVERVRDLGRDPERLGRRAAFPVEPLAQRLALDEGHDVEELAVGFTRVEEREGCAGAAGWR